MARDVFKYRQPTPGGGWVGFVFGALLGALLGFSWRAPLPGDGWWCSWPVIVGSALVVGLLGARYGDRFWQRFVGWLHWLRW